MLAEGTFQVTMQPEPPYHDAEGLTLARAAVDKRFSGALEATSTVQMLAARTTTPGSAAYVALELVTGTLDGRQGSFALVHLGMMARGENSLTVNIVPDSGSGQLRGLAGSMNIVVEDGKHSYALDYNLPG